MGYPARLAIRLSCRARAGVAEIFNQRRQRLGAIAQIARLRRPVVHLHIDVCRPVTTPWRLHLVVPNALEIRRLRAGRELLMSR